MNKFLTFPGKQPVYLGDIDFMQTAVGQALSNLLKNITGRADANGILHGVVISYANNVAYWTAGVVSLGGEILPVDAGSVDATSGLYFDIVSASSGTRTFGDGESHDCWESRSAVIVKTATDYPLASVPRITPPSQLDAQVYGFDDVPNLADRYAKLVYTGGSFLLMIRQQPIAEVQNNYFEGDVSNLPEYLLNKFLAQGSPNNVTAQVRYVPASSDTQSNTVLKISWSVVSDKLHVVVPFATPSFVAGETELYQILPVF